MDNASLSYIALNSGGNAFYEGGNGTSVLRFLYTVGEGDVSADLDVAVYTTDVTSTVVIIIPGNAAILDRALASPAVITLPKPGEEGSLGNDADVIIDTT